MKLSEIRKTFQTARGVARGIERGIESASKVLEGSAPRDLSFLTSKFQDLGWRPDFKQIQVRHFTWTPAGDYLVTRFWGGVASRPIDVKVHWLLTESGQTRSPEPKFESFRLLTASHLELFEGGSFHAEKVRYYFGRPGEKYFELVDSDGAIHSFGFSGTEIWDV